MNKTYNLFITTMISGTMITMFSNNWLGMWMGMELNMMSFMPIINMKPNKSSPESSLIYFMIQVMGSSIMLMSVMLYMMNKSPQLLNMMLTTSLLIKTGAAPFHLWLPKIMSSMPWSSNIILMTWQKIIPLHLINLIEMNNVIEMSIIMSVILGSLGGLYQVSLRKMMSYSSISHLGWMMSLNKTKDTWVLYLILYSTMTVILCKYLDTNNLIYINQLFNMKLTTLQKMNFTVMMLSMGGMPPLLGFLPKWLVIEEMMLDKSLITIMIMIMFSMLTLFFYLHIMMKLLMNYASSNKWSSFQLNYSNMMFFMNLMLPMIIMIY
nr:NADH dehydrogenase subunit 2 [Urochela rubra]